MLNTAFCNLSLTKLSIQKDNNDSLEHSILSENVLTNSLEGMKDFASNFLESVSVITCPDYELLSSL